MNARIAALTIPKLGLTMKEGTVAAWHVKVGDAVTEGQPVFDVETEKVTSECVAESGGVLRRRPAGAGAPLPVGALVGVIAAADVADAEIDRFIAGFKPEQQA
jgi:pyruvate/2-oxoglutarate dehydrogenase complex dihydrolipoamide acyltransferase (E2) component